MDSEILSAPTGDLDGLIGELDDQVLVLGRLFSARQSGSAGGVHPHGHGAISPLTMSQVSLLRAVSEGPVKMSDIASRLGVRPPAVSALVDAAEHAAYVTRDSDRADRRVTRVTLTEAGRDALSTADGNRREMLRRHASVLSRDDLRALIRIQQILIDAMISDRI